MAATVVINEFNGAGEVKTASITNSNMGSTDAVNLTPASYPIAAGENSYEKYQVLEVTNMGGSTKVKTIKVWRTGALSGADVHVTNAGVGATYDAVVAYTQPIDEDSTAAVNTMPSSEPGGANLGIGGSLAGELAAAGSSDFLVHQIQVDAATTSGASTTLNFKYTEIA